jgi:predicted Zn finger-like uncharacterized protein
MLVECASCQTTYTLPDERIPPIGASVQCTRCQAVFWVTRPQPFPPPQQLPQYDFRPGYDVAGTFGNPLRSAPQRAWLERAQPATDLLRPRAWPVVIGALPSRVEPEVAGWLLRLRRPIGGTFTLDVDDGPPLLNGAVLATHPARLSFHTNGAPPVREHLAALDENPLDPGTWRVWADLLLEQGDELGTWLNEKRRSESELEEQLGALQPLVRDRLVRVNWNPFGFIEGLELSAWTLALHPFVADSAHVPGARYLVTLSVIADGGLTAALTAFDTMVLPRSLRHLRLSVTGGADLRARLRARCPHLDP